MISSMDPSIHIVGLPLGFLALPIGGLVLLWLVSFLLLGTSSTGGTSSGVEQERDWGIPAIDAQAHLDSPFHRWDPRIKIASLTFFIFCVASVSQLSLAFFAVTCAALSVRIARIPFRRPLRRLTAMGAFLALLLVVMPLTVPARSGDTLIVFDRLSSFPFSLRGFQLALLICLKASAIALMIEPLLGTSLFSVTIQALARLKVPSMVCQMILLAHRYIFVFQNEAGRMRKGMSARGFHERTDIETLRTIGNFLGMLLVRSFERTQRVYEAMLARGYDGNLQSNVEFNAQDKDWVKGAFWIAMGVVLLIADRTWELPGVQVFWKIIHETNLSGN